MAPLSLRSPECVVSAIVSFFHNHARDVPLSEREAVWKLTVLEVKKASSCNPKIEEAAMRALGVQIPVKALPGVDLEKVEGGWEFLWKESKKRVFVGDANASQVPLFTKLTIESVEISEECSQASIEALLRLNEQQNEKRVWVEFQSMPDERLQELYVSSKFLELTDFCAKIEHLYQKRFQRILASKQALKKWLTQARAASSCLKELFLKTIVEAFLLRFKSQLSEFHPVSYEEEELMQFFEKAAGNGIAKIPTFLWVAKALNVLKTRNQEESKQSRLDAALTHIMSNRFEGVKEGALKAFNCQFIQEKLFIASHLKDLGESLTSDLEEILVQRSPLFKNLSHLVRIFCQLDLASTLQRRRLAKEFVQEGAFVKGLETLQKSDENENWDMVECAIIAIRQSKHHALPALRALQQITSLAKEEVYQRIVTFYLIFYGKEKARGEILSLADALWWQDENADEMACALAKFFWEDEQDRTAEALYFVWRLKGEVKERTLLEMADHLFSHVRKNRKWVQSALRNVKKSFESNSHLLIFLKKAKIYKELNL